MYSPLVNRTDLAVPFSGTGQSITSIVTVTNKLGDETTVVFGGDWESQCINVTMAHFDYIDWESQCLNVTILKMMWWWWRPRAKLISHEVLSYPWVELWIIFMIIGEVLKGNNKRGMSNIDYNVRLWVIPGHYSVFVNGDAGIYEPPNRSEFSKRGSRNPRTTESVWIFKGGGWEEGSIRIFKGEAWIHGRLNRSEFLKEETRIHEPLNRSKFLKGDAGIHEPPNRSKFSKKGSRNPRTADPVSIFIGGDKNPRTAEPVWNFKGGDKNPRTAESVWNLKGDAEIHGRLILSEFEQGDAWIRN